MPVMEENKEALSEIFAIIHEKRSLKNFSNSNSEKNAEELEKNIESEFMNSILEAMKGNNKVIKSLINKIIMRKNLNNKKERKSYLMIKKENFSDIIFLLENNITVNFRKRNYLSFDHSIMKKRNIFRNFREIIFEKPVASSQISILKLAIMNENLKLVNLLLLEAEALEKSERIIIDLSLDRFQNFCESLKILKLLLITQTDNSSIEIKSITYIDRYVMEIFRNIDDMDIIGNFLSDKDKVNSEYIIMKENFVKQIYKKYLINPIILIRDKVILENLLEYLIPSNLFNRFITEIKILVDNRFKQIQKKFGDADINIIKRLKKSEVLIQLEDDICEDGDILDVITPIINRNNLNLSKCEGKII